ncbi:ISAs1 family transposase, partial [Chelonobacter oris]|uniref:ISAs1 family transposase n=1 Tax=Chelonobacter oris TaxID=505317 RepID=UPI00244BE915
YLHKLARNAPELIETYEETVCERGRIDHRVYHKVAVTDWLSESVEWPGIKSILCVSRTREDKTGGKQQETAFYISSLEADAKQLAQSIRGHWEMENKAHWVLDVVYKEDDCPINAEDGAENM